MIPISTIWHSQTKKIYFSLVCFAVVLLFVLPIASVFALTHVTNLSGSSEVYNLSSYPGDYYAWGNCTWWVAMRRSQIGEPIPNSWGNAATWAYYAASDGYIVDHIPTPGSIMQTPDVDHGLGHVAFVEAVDPDGVWHISEMNVLGLDVVDDKTMPASAATNYYFIHQPGGY